MLSLSPADLQQIAEEQNAWLASPPLSDDELAELRQQYPEQAWAYTREMEDGLRRALEDVKAGRTIQVDSIEEMFAVLDADSSPDADL